MARKKESKVSRGYSSMKEKQFLDRASELEYPTDRLGAGSLMTQQSHTNSSRLIMANQQFTHMVNIKDPELPLVPSGFEDTLGAYSYMLDQVDGNYKIVAKFTKNQYNYVLVGYDKERQRYHAWRRVELEEHSEGFSTRYNNSYMDSLEIGDVVSKDEYITKSESFDKHLNYRYGRNLNTVYSVSTQVLEDGIVLMNGAENKMNTFRCTTHEINLGENEVLLNWNGTDDKYQGIPLVGQKVKKSIICAIRQIDNAYAPYILKRKNLQHIERGDRVQYGDGRVIDITILYNKTRDTLSDTGVNAVIANLYDQQQTYYRDLYRYMIDIVDHADEEGVEYSDEFSAICAEAYDFIDAAAHFADSNDNPFGNMRLIIRLMNEEKLSVGSKLVGRYGNKGVVSKIVSLEDSWVMEDGTPVDIVVAALGVVGRLNQSQLNEFSINELSATAVDIMRVTDDLDDKLAIVYRLLDYLNPDEGKSFRKYTKRLSSKEKKKVCQQIERNGITVIQDPIDNANIMDIAKAYEEFPAHWRKIRFPDGTTSIRKVLCAKMFYMRLKQDPLEKYSVRSRGPVNPLTTLPAKSTLKKRGLSPHSDVPVRFGEYEMEVLLAMCPHPAAVARFMTENSTSYQSKIKMGEHGYLDDLDTDLDLSDIDFNTKKNMEAISAYNNILSSHIRFTVEEAPDGEFFDD